MIEHDKFMPYILLSSVILMGIIYYFFGDTYGCIAEVSKERPCFYLESEGGTQKICTGADK